MTNKHFYRHLGCLDVSHAFQTVSIAINDMYKESEKQENKYLSLQRASLYHDWLGLEQELNKLRLELPTSVWDEYGEKLYNYFANHSEHLNYYSRLQSGYSIGSGQVERANKHLSSNV